MRAKTAYLKMLANHAENTIEHKNNNKTMARHQAHAYECMAYNDWFRGRFCTIDCALAATQKL